MVKSDVDIEREKTEKMIDPTLDLILRLRIRANIRRQISTRKSVQEGKPDRLAELLEESANELSRLKNELEFERNRNIFSFSRIISLFGENNSLNLTKYDTMFSLNNNPTLESRLCEQRDYAIWGRHAADDGWDG